MSVFSVAGVIFALPAAFLLVEWAQASGLVALGCTIIGSIIGVLPRGRYIVVRKNY